MAGLLVNGKVIFFKVVFIRCFVRIIEVIFYIVDSVGSSVIKG